MAADIELEACEPTSFWCDAQPQKPVAIFMVGHGGGGHKASALAVSSQLLADLGVGAVQVEVIDAGDFAQSVLGGPNGDDMYNWLMKKNLFCLAGELGRIAACGQPCVSAKLEEAFAGLWRDWRPAVVVSFVPFVNVPMRRALLRVCPGARLVTCVTDFESTSAHLWLDPRDEYARNHIVVAGTGSLLAAALQLGYAESILRTSGMVVHAAFADAAAGRKEGRARARKAVVYFGGQPPNRAEQVACSLLEVLPPEFEVVVLCGKNKELFARLEALRAQAAGAATLGGPSLRSERQASRCCFRPAAAAPEMARCRPAGFLTPPELAAHLIEARLVVGKPGPGACAEAAACGAAFVSERRGVMPQEKAVLNWLEATGNGLVIDDLEHPPADLYARTAACTPKAGTHNQASAEVSHLLQLLLRGAGPDEVTQHLVESVRLRS